MEGDRQEVQQGIRLPNKARRYQNQMSNSCDRKVEDCRGMAFQYLILMHRAV